MDKDWMVLLKGQNQLSNVIKTNETTEQFGLSLTEQDAKLILAERKNALAEQKAAQEAKSAQLEQQEAELERCMEEWEAAQTDLQILLEE